MTEFFLDKFQNLLVGDVAGGGDEKMAGGEPILEALVEALAIEFADGFRSAENRAAQGMIGPKATREDVVEEVLGIIEIHLDLFEDDLALFLHVIGIELGPENEVGKNIEGDGKVLVENLGIETDLLFRGESVEHAADGIHFARDVFSGT